MNCAGSNETASPQCSMLLALVIAMQVIRILLMQVACLPLYRLPDREVQLHTPIHCTFEQM